MQTIQQHPFICLVIITIAACVTICEALKYARRSYASSSGNIVSRRMLHDYDDIKQICFLSNNVYALQSAFVLLQSFEKNYGKNELYFELELECGLKRREVEKRKA